MPLICSLPKCKGNYRNGPKVNEFFFLLKNDSLKWKWVNEIGMDQVAITQYHVSIQEVFECESKLRVYSLLKISLTLAKFWNIVEIWNIEIFEI